MQDLNVWVWFFGLILAGTSGEIEIKSLSSESVKDPQHTERGCNEDRKQFLLDELVRPGASGQLVWYTVCEKKIFVKKRQP